MIKGLSFQEIADIRDVSVRTIHQQSRSIYQKSSVHDRSEFVSGFLEDLIGDNPNQGFLGNNTYIESSQGSVSK